MPTSALYCPACGKQNLHAIKKTHYLCRSCEFVFYRNAASATAAIIRYADEILFTVREKDPAKGKLDLPGGFVDPGESLEQGLRRELREELGLLVESMQYLGSLPNDYMYRNVLYDTCDTFFELWFEYKPDVEALDEVSELRWLTLEQLNPELLAFDSQKQMLLSLKNAQS